MKRLTGWTMIAALIAPLLAPALAWPACTVQSGPKTAALVELYTSEGCSSCPPADSQLSQMSNGAWRADQVVPIALHVDYWDYIGWNDPYARPAFAARQSWLVQANHHRTSYTPHFFASGSEVQDWRGDLAGEIRRINAQNARASISVSADNQKPGLLSVRATAATSAQTGEPLSLYLAVTENQLVSQVKSGENGGATLHHDHVVREWIGPIALTDGKATAQQDVAVSKKWNSAQVGLVGFVQNGRTGEVLQAVGVERCLAS